MQVIESTHQSDILHWIQLRDASHWEVNSELFLSACLLPETKTIRDELFTFVYAEAMWAFTRARVSRGV